MKSLVALACCAVGLYLLSLALGVWGLPRAATYALGAAYGLPGAILLLGGVVEGMRGSGVKAQGAAHGAAKRAGEGVGP